MSMLLIQGLDASIFLCVFVFVCVCVCVCVCVFVCVLSKDIDKLSCSDIVINYIFSVLFILLRHLFTSYLLCIFVILCFMRHRDLINNAFHFFLLPGEADKSLTCSPATDTSTDAESCNSSDVATPPASPIAVSAAISSTIPCSPAIALSKEDEIPVRVLMRARPLNATESASCIKTQDKTISIGKHKFTYDYLFDEHSSQEEVYETSVKHLIDGYFAGFNATVLAYGQTGSGKTYTMGGGYGVNIDSDKMGIIPRVVREIFKRIDDLTDHEVTVSISYLELYMDDLRDLLNSSKDSTITIREKNGSIKLQGLTELTVDNMEETMNYLTKASHKRTTASTRMNESSSRSHAVFTIHLEKQSKENGNDFCQAKFHLVDLAGSERQKKTGATGNSLREGIKINGGLLHLGTVIQKLGDREKHIPYRDSKLTRLLQDSIGGNSHTLMIACVSPSEYNKEESITTCRYADRARRIKNKPMVNRKPEDVEIQKLKKDVETLQVLLLNNKVKKEESEEQAKMKACEANELAAMYAEKYLAQLKENQNLRKIISTTKTEIEDVASSLPENEHETAKKLNDIAKICDVEPDRNGKTNRMNYLIFRLCSINKPCSIIP